MLPTHAVEVIEVTYLGMLLTTATYKPIRKRYAFYCFFLDEHGVKETYKYLHFCTTFTNTHFKFRSK